MISGKNRKTKDKVFYGKNHEILALGKPTLSNADKNEQCFVYILISKVTEIAFRWFPHLVFKSLSGWDYEAVLKLGAGLLIDWLHDLIRPFSNDTSNNKDEF